MTVALKRHVPACARDGGGAGPEADEVGVVRRGGFGLEDERDRGGVPAGVLTVVADDELRRVGFGGLDLLRGHASLVWLVRAPVVTPAEIEQLFDSGS
uniref:Uncharacterized protein n=1 Tax=Oryza brachyantha TaxID=4533 RepID=J3MP58_ORYBR